MKKFSMLLGAISIALLCGCRKILEIKPPIKEIVGEAVYNNTESASSVLIGIYFDLANQSFATGPGSLSVNLGLAADEFEDITKSNPFYSNSLSSQEDYYWSELYRYIFRVNSAIEGLSASHSLTPDVKKRLLGEAKFLRGFLYFYLINLFGDVPLLIHSDYKENERAPRTSTSEVYIQIIADLSAAQSLLGENYVAADIFNVSQERARPNKAAATAMLARVYLYTNQWELAEKEATKLIEDSTNYRLEDLDEVFLKNNKEAIWQLQPVVDVNDGRNTFDAFYFIHNTNLFLTHALLGSFLSNDERKNLWIIEAFQGVNIFNPYKYKVIAETGGFKEYLTVLRLGEQYLVRSEARAQTGDIMGALEDLNKIRQRAGLRTIQESDKEDIINALLKERQLELFSEWGHRWFDLKRSGRIDTILGGIKNDWRSTDMLLPIPSSELLKNPSLTNSQNPGY